jgi:hypothetical protein
MNFKRKNEESYPNPNSNPNLGSESEIESIQNEGRLWTTDCGSRVPATILSDHVNEIRASWTARIALAQWWASKPIL